MSSNNFTGGLSSTWGAPGVFPNLVTMDLSQNYLLGGILLTQWGTPGSFPKLEVRLCPLRLFLEQRIADVFTAFLYILRQGPGYITLLHS